VNVYVNIIVMFCVGIKKKRGLHRLRFRGIGKHHCSIYE